MSVKLEQKTVTVQSRCCLGTTKKQSKKPTEQSQKSLKNKMNVPPVGCFAGPQCHLVLSNFHEIKAQAGEKLVTTRHSPNFYADWNFNALVFDAFHGELRANPAYYFYDVVCYLYI